MCEPDKHRWEYFGVQQGEETWKCLACGEQKVNYNDHNGG